MQLVLRLLAFTVALMLLAVCEAKGCDLALAMFQCMLCDFHQNGAN